MPPELKCSRCDAMMKVEQRGGKAVCPYCSHEVVFDQEAASKSAADELRAAHMAAAWDNRLKESRGARRYLAFWLVVAVLLVAGTFWFVLYMVGIV